MTLDSLMTHPALTSFLTVAPRTDINPSDLRMSDGTPMIGSDSFLLPGARNFSMIVNSANRIYSYRFDEAMRDNFVAARAMRRDAFIRGLIEERILPTINRRWQIEVADSADPDQRFVQDELTKLVDAIPDFDVYKRALLDGVWYGRAGVQQSYARDRRCGNRWGVSKWEPVHGDSVQFTFDGVPAILMDGMTAGWYSDRGATRGPWGDLRGTDRGGMALVLNRPYWRDRFVIHQHIREKADFFEGELAGSVQGLGLRGLVYWQYVVRTDALTWMLAYMQSVGQMDMLIFNYPWGNDAAKRQQEANANKIIGKAAIIVPRNPQGNWPAVEQLSMNDAGLKALHDLIAEYFDRHIERLIVGQSMSAGMGGPGGLEGDGRSEFAKETKDEILIYDTNRLDNVLTRDLLKPLLRYNFKWVDFKVAFKSVLPNLEGPQKVEAGTMLIQSGIAVKVDEMREAAGFSRPEDGDEIVGGMPPPMPGMGDPNDPNAQLPPDDGSGMPPDGGQLPMGPVEAPADSPPMPFSGGGRGRTTYIDPAGPVGGGGSAMGYPGGSNTYIPRFGGVRALARRDDETRRRGVGYQKATGAVGPIQYADDLIKGMGKAVRKFTPKQMDGIRVWANPAKQRVWIDVMDWGDGDIGGALEAAAARLVGKDSVERVNEGMIPDGKRGWTNVLDKINYTRPSAPIAYKAGPHKFCTTHVELTGPAAIKLLAAANTIPDDRLCWDEGGRETEPHVTILYGLHAGTLESVRRIVAATGPIKLKLGRVTVFPGPAGKDYDVVKVDVDSPDLRRLNYRLKALPHTETHGGIYRAHATIAYVRKGLGNKIAAAMPPLGVEFTAREIVFCDQSGTPTTIPTAGPVPYRRGLRR